jgi:hypothetical protein
VPRATVVVGASGLAAWAVAGLAVAALAGAGSAGADLAGAALAGAALAAAGLAARPRRLAAARAVDFGLDRVDAERVGFVERSGSPFATDGGAGRLSLRRCGRL